MKNPFLRGAVLISIGASVAANAADYASKSAALPDGVVLTHLGGLAARCSNDLVGEAQDRPCGA
jgi:hypothetical protein